MAIYICLTTKIEAGVIMSVWGQDYHGLKIRADYRVHDKIIEMMKILNLNNGDLLDIACGEGTLSQRVINEFSMFDRIFYLLYGYHYYFGTNGIINSGNHITMAPLWLMDYICESNGLSVTHKNYTDTFVHISWRFYLFKMLMFPFLCLAKNKNDASINIIEISQLTT